MAQFRRFRLPKSYRIQYNCGEQREEARLPSRLLFRPTSVKLFQFLHLLYYLAFIFKVFYIQLNPHEDDQFFSFLFLSKAIRHLAATSAY